MRESISFALQKNFVDSQLLLNLRNTTMRIFKFQALLFLCLSQANLFGQTLAEGTTLLDQENYAGARKIFSQLIQKNPEDGEVYYYLGESYYLTEKTDSARYFYNKGIEMSSKSPFNYTGLGKLALDAKNAKEAQKQFDIALRYGKKNAKAYIAVGRAYLDGDNKDPDKAIDVLTPITADYKDPAIFETLGDAYVMKNDGGKAMTNYGFAIDKVKNPTYYMKQAQIWMNAKLYDEAAKSLESVIELNPKFAPAYKKLIDVYNFQGKYSKVTPLLEKYTSLVGNDMDARENYVKFLWFQAKNYDKAIEEGQKIIAADTSRYTMNRFIAMSYFEKGEYQKTTDYFQKLFSVIGSRKVYTSDYDIYARALEKVGQKEAALQNYLKLLEMDPTRTDFFDNMAKTYREAKDYKKVIEIYNLKQEKAGKLGTNDYYYLGQANYQTENYPAADSAYAKYCELFPNLTGYYWRAKVARAMDVDDKELKAKPYYEKVIEYGEKDREKNKRYLTEAYYYIAFGFYAQKDNENAKLYLNKTLEIDPAHTLANDLLKHITSGGK